MKTALKTILEITEEMGYPSYEVTIWLFAMRRYSEIEEVGGPDIDGYFKYELVRKDQNGRVRVNNGKSIF